MSTFTKVNEIFLPIKNYEGIYEISNQGTLKSLSRKKKHPNGGFSNIKAKILIPDNVRGYYHFRLSKNSKTKVYKAHRLVAEAFISNTDNLPVINHINGVKNDNRVENLEWCTVRHNTSEYYKSIKTASDYTGVCRMKNGWGSYINIKGKRIHIGIFEKEEDAGNAYLKKLKEFNNAPSLMNQSI